ncbi:hypothetical protein [Streptomyces solincola]|nr:hypothetical protein [Streptomyces solincola]
MALSLLLVLLPRPTAPAGAGGPAAEVTRLYAEAARATEAYE